MIRPLNLTIAAPGRKLSIQVYFHKLLQLEFVYISTKHGAMLVINNSIIVAQDRKKRCSHLKIFYQIK